MPDSIEPPLREVFVEQACEVMYDGFDEARRELDNWPDMPATWPYLVEPERVCARHAVGKLIDWLDSRRL